MLARKTLLAAAAVLAMTVPAYAEFSAILWWGDDTGAALPAQLPADTAITIYLWDTQTYEPGNPNGDNLFDIQLNVEASSAELLLTAANAWAWDAVVSGGLTGSMDDSTQTDGLVHRAGSLGPPIQTINPPAGGTGGNWRMGNLTFTTPSYNPGGPNDYLVSLGGGVVDEVQGIFTVTYLADGANLLLDPKWGLGGGLTTNDYQFEVMPEPATLALLAMGGLATLLRRR